MPRAYGGDVGIEIDTLGMSRKVRVNGRSHDVTRIISALMNVHVIVIGCIEPIKLEMHLVAGPIGWRARNREQKGVAAYSFDTTVFTELRRATRGRADPGDIWA